MAAEILVVTGPGQGHLRPCMELCNHLSTRNYRTTLIIPSSLFPSVPTTFSHKTLPIATPAGIMPGPDSLKEQAAQELEAHLENSRLIPNLPPPICAIVDFQMGWTKAHFWKFNLPVIGLFTFGACAAAMEWGAWKAQAGDIRPGETRFIPWLPKEMGLTCSDLKRKPFGSPQGGGPPKPGDKPPWIAAIEGSIALMFNTCNDLERPFLNYIADQISLPVFGVAHFYHQSTGTPAIRPPPGKMNEVGPTLDEYAQLASALEESTRPFIWAIQSGSGYSPEGLLLDEKVGDRGMIICGWGPQLVILSHESMEAIGRGVKILAWPIRGDQHYNAKLVVNQFKVGYKVKNDVSEMVMEDDIMKGIEMIMEDEEMGNRVLALREIFSDGFPASSEVALDAFKDFVNQKTRLNKRFSGLYKSSESTV
ncbi:hypothetical protein PTKIN_Ptkin04bG0237700 [Pterospermum kingtungense]